MAEGIHFSKDLFVFSTHMPLAFWLSHLTKRSLENIIQQHAQERNGLLMKAQQSLTLSGDFKMKRIKGKCKPHEQKYQGLWEERQQFQESTDFCLTMRTLTAHGQNLQLATLSFSRALAAVLQTMKVSHCMMNLGILLRKYPGFG